MCVRVYIYPFFCFYFTSLFILKNIYAGLITTACCMHNTLIRILVPSRYGYRIHIDHYMLFTRNNLIFYKNIKFWVLQNILQYCHINGIILNASTQLTLKGIFFKLDSSIYKFKAKRKIIFIILGYAKSVHFF